MKSLWNSFRVAFAMYSKIPVPVCDWTQENMRYAMCFFPLVGAVEGILFYLWQSLCILLNDSGCTLQKPFVAAISMCIPVLITGGIHLDGFMDTVDALSSHREKDRALEILSDSRVGAFAVLMCSCYFILSFGAYSQITPRAVPVICISFILSRILSAIAIIKFPLAKNTGLAKIFSDGANKRTVYRTMLVYFVAAVIFSIYYFKVLGAVLVTVCLAVFIWYYKMSKKRFGGITGDVAGFFLQVCELASALAVVFADAIL